MAAVTELITLLEAKVEELLPTCKKSSYVYDPDKNTSLADINYGVKIGSASSSAGLNGHITIDQSFDIELSRKFIPKKGEGDTDVQNKAATISTDIETLYKTLYRRPGAIASGKLLLISPVDVTAPDIDNDNNLVTLTLTLNVKYRVAI